MIVILTLMHIIFMELHLVILKYLIIQVKTFLITPI